MQKPIQDQHLYKLDISRIKNFHSHTHHGNIIRMVKSTWIYHVYLKLFHHAYELNYLHLSKKSANVKTREVWVCSADDISKGICFERNFRRTFLKNYELKRNVNTLSLLSSETLKFILHNQVVCSLINGRIWNSVHDVTNTYV